MGTKTPDGRRLLRGAAALAAALVAAVGPAFGAAITVYGGAAIPVGGMASGDYGYFNWLIEDDPGTEHDLVDIRGLTLTGTGGKPCPVAGVRGTVGLAPWLEAEAAAFHLFTRPNESGPKSAVENPETRITAATAGAAYVRALGPFRATAGGGAGFYFTEVALSARGEGRSGFVYSNVHTLEDSVRTDGVGAYAGAGVSCPLGAGLAVSLSGRYHRVFNGGTYQVFIFERYGYDPYHFREYTFDTPLHKEYDDQFVELGLGLTYGVP